MAILDIRKFPDPVLRKVAAPVVRFDDELTQIVTDMAETMYAEPGVGLAAPQVGISLRLFIGDLRSCLQEMFVNPQHVAQQRPTQQLVT